MLNNVISILKRRSANRTILVSLIAKTLFLKMIKKLGITTFSWMFTGTGQTHLRMNPQKSIEYIEKVMQKYLYFIRGNGIDITGKTILEIGPGDNLGIALEFLCKGAKKVFAIDKYYSNREPEKQIQVYRALYDSISRPEKKVFEKIVKITPKNIILNTHVLKYIYNIPFENCKDIIDEKIDIIISNAVLEHLRDPVKALKVMFDLLKNGGIMIHEIDLRDHQIFSPKNPLFFLKVAPWIWNLLSSMMDYPNRLRNHDYIDICNKLGFSDVQTKLIARYKKDLINQGKLSKKNKKTDDYEITVIQLYARK